MAASRDAEDSVSRAARDGLTRWLRRARDAVLAPFQRFGSPPSADAVYSVEPAWRVEVDRILAALTPALREGWVGADLPRDYNPSDPYIQAALALTRNLIVRLPDEVHAKVVAIILDGSNKGQSTDQVAARIDDLLTYTGSENWDGRARLIAQTETTRHFSSSMLAHALTVQQQDGTALAKKWIAHDDGRTRMTHVSADNQVRRLEDPFDVGDIQMLFPGDPSAPAEEVCNCRCWPKIIRLAT